jgi:NitT/TauT family transport system ATP-binding protein
MARRKTVLFITHSIPEALLLSDRLIIMSARPGRVMEEIECPLPGRARKTLWATPAFTEIANHIRSTLLTRTAA